MSLPFGNHVPAHYYEMALDDAAKLLGTPSASLTSLKIRPLTEWPITKDSDFHNAYVYPAEYEAVYRWLGSSALEQMDEGFVSGGKAICLRARSGDLLVFVEHETGPEIVVALALTTATVSLIKEVVGLVKEILKGINEKNEAKKKGTSGGRFYEAAAISIEERTPHTSRVIRVIPLPLKPSGLTDSEIEDILRSR